MRNAPDGSDGRMHPNRLLAALQRRAADADAIVVADGGDFLASRASACRPRPASTPARSAASASARRSASPPALRCPTGTVVVATGDGAFGFNAMEIDTAVRHRAPVLIVVANNGAWQIEVHDQPETHGKVVGTRLQFADHAAMARAFGLHGERVERADDLPGGDRARAGQPAGAARRGRHAGARSSDGKSGLAWVPDLQPLAAWDGAERNWRGAR